MYRRGFSLVELSIVLVILGLLTGGILGGQALIRAAELRAVPTELSSHVTAINTFRDKYFALPGDMDNAERFWQSHTVCGGGNADGVCNGDGDGRIDDPLGPGDHGESHQIWRHLAKAGRINGDYTGIAGPGEVNGYGLVVNENAPGSKLSGAIWSVLYRDEDNFNRPDIDFTLVYNNHFIFGRYLYDRAPQTSPGVLTPAEAWNIDQKIDDGRPGKGRLIARRWDDVCSSAIDDSSSTTDYEAEYRLSEDDKLCTFLIRDYF